MSDATWIAADWDGGELCLWRVSPGAQPAELLETFAAGSAAEATAKLDTALRTHRAANEATPIRVNGIGAAPNRKLPCLAAPELGATTAAAVHFPSFAQDTPPATSAGAEAAIAGYVAAHTDFDGILCVLGHTHVWAHISAREIVSFRAASTPAFANTLEGGVPALSGIDSALFDSAVADGMSKPENMLLAQEGDGAAVRFLGALIGAELAAMRPYWLGQNVVVLGDNAFTPLYLQALRSAFVPVEAGSRREMVLAGLRGWCAA